MITGKDIYSVLSAIVPLYVAMLLAYGSVRWWKIFSPQQCAGINRFVAVFAVPLLSFHFISSNNPYSMNYQFIAADSLQKIVVLVALFLWQALTKSGNLEWMITLFSLSTLPNTLVMGIPLLKAMYGDFSGDLMVQIVVLQSIIWYTLMLLMFEYRGAKLLISEQFPETAASIVSFKVDSDVVSLNGREPLMADAEIGEDGKLHVVLRRSSASSMASSFNKSNGFNSLTSITPRASNLTGVEIYSVQSSREPTPRGSSFNQTDFYAMFASKVPSPKNGVTPRNSNFEDETTVKNAKKKVSGGRSMSEEMMSFNGDSSVRPTSNPSGGLKKTDSGGSGIGSGVTSNKELHMFVWSSSPSPATTDRRSSSKLALQHDSAIATPETGKGEKEEDIEEGSKHEVNVSPYNGVKKIAGVEDGDIDGDQKKRQMPPASVMTRLILIMVWRKLIRNPNTYSSLIGLTWSLISFKWHIEMPLIVKGSISILSDAGLGMAMFSLGLFMALQPNIIACGKSVATFSMAVRFLTGPAVIAATSIAVGLRGVLLHVAIVQAALPQGIVPFVFAKEYNVHPDILSTAVIFGMLVALPITILYYVVLGV